TRICSPSPAPAHAGNPSTGCVGTPRSSMTYRNAAMAIAPTIPAASPAVSHSRSATLRSTSRAFRAAAAPLPDARGCGLRADAVRRFARRRVAPRRRKEAGLELLLAPLERRGDPVQHLAHRGPRDPPPEDGVEHGPEQPERRTVRAFEREPGRFDGRDPEAERPMEQREEPRPRVPLDRQRVVEPARLLIVRVQREDHLHRRASRAGKPGDEVAERYLHLDGALGVAQEVLGVLVRHGERAPRDALDDEPGDPPHAVIVPIALRRLRLLHSGAKSANLYPCLALS